MKCNKLILFVVFILLLPTGVAHCSQKQEGKGWFASFASVVSRFFQSKSSLSSNFESQRPKRFAQNAGFAVPGALAGAFAGDFFLMSLGFYVPIILAGTYEVVGLVVTAITDDIIKYGNEQRRLIVLELAEEEKKELAVKARQAAVDKVVMALSTLIVQKSVWPTRSSQINALLKKDEFLDYIDDKDGIVEEASNKLLKQIVDAKPLSSDEVARQTAIDTYISKLRAPIALLPLEEQIKKLEEIEKDSRTVNEATGYISLLSRLRNKFDVEKRLSFSEKESRNPWQKAILESMLQKSKSKEVPKTKVSTD